MVDWRKATKMKEIRITKIKFTATDIFKADEKTADEIDKAENAAAAFISKIINAPDFAALSYENGQEYKILTRSTRPGEDLQFTSICKRDMQPTGHEIIDRDDDRDFTRLCRVIGLRFSNQADRVITIY